MNQTQFLSDYRQLLAKNGLPNAYINRVAEELHDHLEDIAASGKEISQIGTLQDVSQAAINGFRSQTFAGRHPLLINLLSSTFLLPFLWILYFVFAAMVFDVVFPFLDSKEDWNTGPMPTLVYYIVLTYYRSSFVIPFLIASWIGTKWATYCGRGITPLLFVISLQLFLSITCFSCLEIPTMAGQEGDLSVCFSPLTEISELTGEQLPVNFMQQMLQMWTVLTVGIYAILQFFFPFNFFRSFSNKIKVA